MSGAITMKVRTYLDSAGLLSAVDEAKRPILQKAAIRIKNRARASMHRAPGPAPTLAELLPGVLKPFARLGARAIYQQAAALGIPASVVSAVLKQSKAGRSGKKRGIPSKPGQPPHIQSGKGKRGIVADMDPKTGNVAVGPSGAGWYLRLHEFGQGKFPARPFMAPALEKERRRLPEGFKDMQISRTKAGRRMNRVQGVSGRYYNIGDIRK